MALRKARRRDLGLGRPLLAGGLQSVFERWSFDLDKGSLLTEHFKTFLGVLFFIECPYFSIQVITDIEENVEKWEPSHFAVGM